MRIYVFTYVVLNFKGALRQHIMQTFVLCFGHPIPCSNNCCTKWATGHLTPTCELDAIAACTPTIPHSSSIVQLHSNQLPSKRTAMDSSPNTRQLIPSHVHGGRFLSHSKPAASKWHTIRQHSQIKRVATLATPCHQQLNASWR